MSFFAVYFNGVYPVGAVATVNALNELDAKQKVLRELERIGLRKFNDLEDLDVEELSTNNVTILLDGNY